MNWRTSSAELSRLYNRSPWLYMIEWRERLERCVQHLEGGASEGRLDPGEALYEAEHLRHAAHSLTNLAELLEARAKTQEKITALRATMGRTTEETVAFLAKADELEERL